MPAKNQFYAVLKGRAPGIYTTWAAAEAQVKGFAGAKFHGFATRAEAEAYLRGQAPPARLPQRGNPLPTPAPAAAEGAPTVRRVSSALEHAADLAEGKLVIYTDGASTGNPGPGGYGVVILSGQPVTRRELSGGFRRTTNNRMELIAVIHALESLHTPIPVVVYSDSRYVVDALNLGWAKRWQARGWMRTATARAENADLWQRLLPLMTRAPVEVRWVRGHAHSPENERCDHLAVQAAHAQDLPEDSGYTG